VRLLAALSALAFLLAGCSGGVDEPTDPEVPDLGLEATPTTGLIRCVVVDEAIRPIGNVTIGLRGNGANATTVTTAEGFCGFDGLQPGSYFLDASKPGYFPSQASADVVAGVAEPPIVKILLAIDVASVPFYVQDKWDGFLECGLSVIALCGAGQGAPVLGNVTNDDFAHVMVVDGVPLLIQSEVVWASTTSASNELWLWHSNGAKPDGAFNGTRDAYAWRQGPSPLVMTSNATEIEESEFGTNNDLYLRMFTGSVSGTRNPVDPEGCYPGDPVADVYCGGVGYSVQQSFTVYTTAFFGYLPPEGWTFSAEGTVPQPPT
jgi:hypothetical protein